MLTVFGIMMLTGVWQFQTRVKRHGLKLLIIEDYPYASDGLLIWEAIQNWVQTYVTRYYPDPSLACNDRELQAWYAEVINAGHADLRYENWWPTLARPHRHPNHRHMTRFSPTCSA